MIREDLAMSATDIESSVLIFAPVGRDAALLSKFLNSEGIHNRRCNTAEMVASELQVGLGMLFITEEAMTAELQTRLSRMLSDQPTWSDLPIVLCVNASSRWSEISLSHLTHQFGNITLLVRPIRRSSLLSTVHVALRSRARQYQVRNYIDECQELTQQLKVVSQRKDDFLAMLGHELRNPLGAVTSALDLMEVEDLDRETADQARDIAKRQTEQITRIVDDLLDISRLLRGRVELNRKIINASDLVNAAVETMQPQIIAHSHALRIVLPPDPVYVYADAGRLRQVLENLLANSCKYTDNGGQIDISLTKADDGARFIVQDNGSGFPKELASQIFDLFAQGEQTLDRSQGGLGIGLTVVREIVELHDGHVTAESPGVNQGSRFSVLIPLANTAPANAPLTTEPIEPAGRRLKVLIVEDNSDLAGMMTKIVNKLGHDSLAVNDGLQATTAAIDFRPDVVLLDIGLPGMNGYEVAKRIRTADETKSALIVGVSGYSQAEDKNQSADAGMDFHYPKPLDIKILKSILADKSKPIDS